MQPKYRFKCATCNEWDEGIPGWGWNYPPHYHVIPSAERDKRCFLTTDLCVVDDEAFYICGCLEFPVVESTDIMSLRVWVSLSEKNFLEFQKLIGVPQRSSYGPYFGWLCVPIPTYPDTMHLKTKVHIRDKGIRPYVELEPTDHPLAVEQREGVSAERIQALYDFFEHGHSTG